MSDLSLEFSEAAVGTSAYRDLVMHNGDLVLTSDVSPSDVATHPTLQLVAARLLFFLGEYFLDTSEGTGWLQSVVVKGASKQSIDAILQERILGTDGVAVLTSYKATAYPAQRMYRVSFSVTTNQGDQLAHTVPVALGQGS